MTVLAGLAMSGAGVACLGGAVLSRRALGVLAAVIMLSAMLDLSFLGVLPAAWWAVALVGAALLLGLDMRLQARADETASRGQLPRIATLTSALAYAAMAWLCLGHGRSAHLAGVTNVGVNEVGAGHSGHLGDGLVSVAPLLFATTLVVLLLGCCALAVRRRRALIAIEAGAMSVMILAMLAM